MNPTKNFRFGNHTDIGQVRHHNEDYLGFFENENGAFFVVCDGMGGHAGGATASQMAVGSIRQFFDSQFFPNPQDAIYQALQYANTQIYQKAINVPELRGMGTTCVLLMLRDNYFYYGHVGDSRIYVYRSGQLTQLTHDHSFVQALIDQGLITEQEAETHPRRNELLRAMGTSPFVEVEIAPEAFKPYQSDVFLLCSDGLTGMVSKQSLENILASHDSLQHKALKMVETANLSGGTDNITVQVVEFLGSTSTSSQATSYSNTTSSSKLGDTQGLSGTASGSNFDPPATANTQNYEPEDVSPLYERPAKKKNKRRLEEDSVFEGDDDAYSSKSRRANINIIDEVNYRPLLLRGFLVLFVIVTGYLLFKHILSEEAKEKKSKHLVEQEQRALEIQNWFYEYTGIQKAKDTYQDVKETVKKTKETLRELNEFKKRQKQALDSLFNNRDVRKVFNTLKKGDNTLRDLATKYRSKMEWIMKANGVESEEELYALDTLNIPSRAPKE